MSKEFINPPELPNWEHAFSQIVVVTSGTTKTIYISGQVAVDKDKNLIGAGDLSVQARQAFQNLETALRVAGAQSTDVVKLNIYVKNYQHDDSAPINETLRKCFPGQPLPASSWLGVQSLAEEGFLIEVDAIAVVQCDE
ncbi:MAG TPA: RidA family protein [Pyrinomonadaceae bacterium]|nr:RidA family protein [Pyrinomonadaceae bacterium]